jgi:hypothetical protein
MKINVNVNPLTNSNTQLPTTAHTKSSQFVFISSCQVTAPSEVDSSAFMFTSLLAGDCLTPDGLLQLALGETTKKTSPTVFLLLPVHCVAVAHFFDGIIACLLYHCLAVDDIPC